MLADDTGTWAALTLLRARDRPDFTPAEVRFVASVAGVLAEGVRRALLDAPRDDAEPVEPGLLVLAPDGTLEMANQAADHWLGELGAGEVSAAADGRPRRRRPGPARRRRGRPRPGPGAHAARASGSSSGARSLGEGADARVAVQLEAARATELAPARRRRLRVHRAGARDHRAGGARATPRTRSPRASHLSAYTVQDHLKSIFDKSGTGSRAELVARLFLDHHAPNLTLHRAESGPEAARVDTAVDVAVGGAHAPRPTVAA